MAHAWGDTSYWVLDDRPRGLTLSMTAIGSDAKHSFEPHRLRAAALNAYARRRRSPISAPL